MKFDLRLVARQQDVFALKLLSFKITTAVIYVNILVVKCFEKAGDVTQSVLA